MKPLKITTFPFETINLLECEISKSLNNHSIAMIKGHIEEELEDKYLELAGEEALVEIIVQSDEEEQLVFSGIVKKMEIKSENHVKTLVAHFVSKSYLLDVVPLKRSFQDANLSYKKMLEETLEPYVDSGLVMQIGHDETINKLIVQYNETDWGFAKRMASYFNTCLVPADLHGGHKFYFGVPQRNQHIVKEQVEYSVVKAVGEYIHKAENDVKKLNETDEIIHQIKSRNIWEIGDTVVFKGKQLSVFQFKSHFNKNELVFSYSLKPKEGLQQISRCNDRITGCSLAGQIIGIKNDLVKVVLDIDGKQDLATAKWFPYSTVYSSPDGTGWYAMPEKNDAIRLYFPSEKEEEAYVISATHLESSNDEQRTNPDNKSLRSKYGKEVLFTPNSILITNNKGMSIELLDAEGIKITSDKAITMVSDESIAIGSLEADLEIIAPEAIGMVQGETQINLKEQVAIYGEQVNVQG